MGLKELMSESTWWHSSYFVDWALGGIVPAIAFTIFRFVSPFCRDFEWTDPTINHEHKGDSTIPFYAFPLLGLIAPQIVAAVVLEITKAAEKNHVTNTAILASLHAYLLPLIVVLPLKKFAGGLRPDFIGRLVDELGYNPLKVIHEPHELGFDPAEYAELACSSSKTVVMDGRESFPSLEASNVTAGWVLCAFVVATRLGLFRPGRPAIFTLLFFFIFLTIPALIGLSLTRDYQHHFTDIVAGACIGAVTGFACFRQYYSPEGRPLNRKEEAEAAARKVETPEQATPVEPDAEQPLAVNEPQAVNEQQ